MFLACGDIVGSNVGGLGAILTELKSSWVISLVPVVVGHNHFLCSLRVQTFPVKNRFEKENI